METYRICFKVNEDLKYLHLDGNGRKDVISKFKEKYPKFTFISAVSVDYDYINEELI